MLHVALATNIALIDGIAFDPFFRGFLSVLTGIVVLCGSVYLLVATNTGGRQGFLIAMASLFGWFFLMGVAWTIYGIGWKGGAPTWDLVEVNVDDAADNDDGLLYSEVAAAAELAPSEGGVPDGGLGNASFDSAEVLDRIADPAARETATEHLGDVTAVGDISDGDLAQEAALVASRHLTLESWRYLETSDPIRGEAQASADAHLQEEGVFTAGTYVPRQFGAFIIDGKPILDENANVIDRVLHTLNETLAHPTFGDEYIVIQVQAAVKQPTLPGKPPPVATADTSAPVVSVIMERNRGGPFPSIFSGLRFQPAMFTVFSGLIFAALAWNLHTRDRREALVRTAA